jgi:deoxyribodipyrimidine photo-lyase
MSSPVPAERTSLCNSKPINLDGRYVLYWMTACRRPCWNFSLDQAVFWAKELGKPLLIVETLATNARWASDRHHAFVIEGMAVNANQFQRAGAAYYPYVETNQSLGDRPFGPPRNLVIALAEDACVLITDDFPISSFRNDIQAVAGRIDVRMEQIDSNGLLPMRVAQRAYPSAYTFRRFLQKTLPDHLPVYPSANPLARCQLPPPKPLPKAIRNAWPAVSPKLLAGDWSLLKSLAIDHSVTVAEAAGGYKTAQSHLRRFLKHRLAQYNEDRNQPELDATSRLAPYLHFGHISVHEILHAVMRWSNWSPERLSDKVTGRAEGWWNMGKPAEAFLDELITWRELGFNMCANRDDYDVYESLPDWAKQTLKNHARDRREYVYTLAQFQRADTHDPLWNAAQRQLVGEGRIHNYLRMLWGKKILEWSASPQMALEIMIELNNKYALDGQDPNSYTGIFWILARYDRPWAPERKIFGTVRYMSSENTRRKFSVKKYLEKYK